MTTRDHGTEVRVNGPDEDLISDGGHELFRSYKEMAIANGVAPDDPALAACRDWQAPVRPDTVEPTAPEEQA